MRPTGLTLATRGRVPVAGLTLATRGRLRRSGAVVIVVRLVASRTTGRHSASRTGGVRGHSRLSGRHTASLTRGTATDG